MADETDETCSTSSMLALTIKRLRIKAGISQERLSDLSGLDRTYISLIERNRRNFTLATLDKLAPHLCGGASKLYEAAVQTGGRECLRHMKEDTCPRNCQPNAPCFMEGIADEVVIEERLRSTVELVSSVTRDIEAPIEAVKTLADGISSRLKGENLTKEEILRAMTWIQDHVDQIQKASENLRSFSEIEVQEKASKLDVLEVVTEQTNGIKRKYPGVSFYINYGNTRPLVVTSDRPSRFSHMIRNMLHFTADTVMGAENPEVRIDVADADGVCTVRVQNNGNLKTSSLGFVFPPSAGSDEGLLGLSLLVVRNIAREHGGDLTVEPKNEFISLATKLPLA